MEQVEMNKEMKLSPHFTLGELCKTSHKTADKNIPSRVVIENLKNLCENWLEDLRYSYNTLYKPTVTSSVVERSPEISPCASCVPLVASEQSSSALSRDEKGHVISSAVEKSQRVDAPLIINSGYRSPEVNELAGGSPTSNHLTGCAVDIRVSGFEQAIRYASILLDISDGTKQEYDELFIERNSAGRYWIHFAVRPKNNRRIIGFIQT